MVRVHLYLVPPAEYHGKGESGTKLSSIPKVKVVLSTVVWAWWWVCMGVGTGMGMGVAMHIGMGMGVSSSMAGPISP